MISILHNVIGSLISRYHNIVLLEMFYMLIFLQHLFLTFMYTLPLQVFNSIVNVTIDCLLPLSSTCLSTLDHAGIDMARFVNREKLAKICIKMHDIHLVNIAIRIITFALWRCSLFNAPVHNYTHDYILYWMYPCTMHLRNIDVMLLMH